MSEFPRPLMPNEMQWNRQRVPYNPQWRPFYEPRAQFHPRDRGLSSYRLPMNVGSEEHWCETCDRGFPSEDLLGQHKQQHQKCNIDGCQFVAHPKVITKHIQMQHSSGLYKKIAKLNNPEEIEKWREERRKKYPTKLNIENKAAALKEKIERGEKMNLERKEWHSTRDNDPNRHPNSGQGTKRSYSTTNNNQPESKFRKATRRPPRKPKDLPQTEENHILAPFAGIQCLGIDITEELEEDIRGLNNDLIEDDEIETNNEDLVLDSDNTKIIEKHVVCNALSLLMCDYGTSDEEIDVIEKPHESKEISKVNKIGNQSLITKKERELKTEIMSQQTNNPNETRKNNIANEVKNINESSQNSVTEIVLSSEIIQNSCNKGFQNNIKINDHSSNRPLITEKNQNAIEINDSGTKVMDLAINTDDKPASSENNNPTPNDDDDDSGPEEVKVDKNAVTTGNVQNSNAVNKTKNVKKKYEAVKRKSFRKPKPKIPSTLIYRLLSKEMKQERNQILQCIRYIRMNNYFDNRVS